MNEATNSVWVKVNLPDWVLQRLRDADIQFVIDYTLPDGTKVVRMDFAQILTYLE